VANASDPSKESFASIAESFGYTPDSEYVRMLIAHIPDLR